MVDTESAIGEDGRSPRRPGTDAGSARPLHDRILHATVRCIAAHGLARPPNQQIAPAVRCLGASGEARTTTGDIARAAGCGRATVYRAFDGGKAAIMVAAGARGLERFLAALATRVDACDTLEDAIVTGISVTSRELL